MNRTPHAWVGRGLPFLVLSLALAAGFSCRRTPESGDQAGADIRGQPIVSPAATGAPPVMAGPAGTVRTAANPTHFPQLKPVPEVLEDGYLRLGFDRLSAFKFEVYEYYSEGQAGRPLLKSDDKIPPLIQAYDGRRVSVRGFALPLRLKKGRVIEFLLMRDLGTCCFGPQAQINHFMRVRFPEGADLDQNVVHRVRGTLKVGETYVQGYLTGIYNLEADSVDRPRD
ncbi:MAG: hypothetical protein RJA22_1953 [Verrucomicrobiota bacterium]|jgi:hypothetical protein